MGFQFNIVWQHLDMFLLGALMTIKITVLAVIIGIILGFLLGMAKLSKNFILRIPATLYVDFIRGTPMLLQLFIIYFGVPQIVMMVTGNPYNPDVFYAGVVGLGLNSGAYVAEIVRAGIQSIDKGQIEAARSLGLTHGQAMRYIILPQAFRRILPPLGNECITLTKDSSLVSTFGYTELMRTAKIIGSKYYSYFEPLMGAAILYLLLTFVISRLVNYLERRYTPND